jgi:hypothetical protein
MVERSVWSDRFLAWAFAQGAIAFGGLGLLLYLAVATTPGPARVVAGGGAGTWFTIGCLAFALVAVLGIGLSALFYHHIEVTLKRPYKGWRNLCGWAHLLAGGGATSVGALLAASSGLEAGIAALPVSAGGGGRDFAYIHANILGPVTIPLAILMFVGLIGFFAGGVGYFASWWSVVNEDKNGVRYLMGRAPQAPAEKSVSPKE